MRQMYSAFEQVAAIRDPVAIRYLALLLAL